MTPEEIEALLRQKYEAGEADTGLYSFGIRFVVMDNVCGELTFQWFDNAISLDNLGA
jgi:hypothetical protein